MYFCSITGFLILLATYMLIIFHIFERLVLNLKLSKSIILKKDVSVDSFKLFFSVVLNSKFCDRCFYTNHILKKISNQWRFLAFSLTKPLEMTKFLLILSFTISNLELLLCKFQNYHDPTDARRVTVFSDSSLRKSFLKANLMCNACNGFLVSHSIQCTAVNGTCNVTESDRIWRGTYFRKLGDGIG